MASEPSIVDRVRDYYDLNTRRWFRRNRDSDTIHRAVWGEGVRSEAEAFRYLDRLVLQEVHELSRAFPPPLLAVDLGCGIGASVIYLASHSAIRATGVTVSGVQARYAADRIERAGLADRVRCLEGDFLHLPASMDPAHVAFSIEAFVHGPDPGAYFAETARLVVPGGLLIVCDDFLTDRARGRLSRREFRMIDEVRNGWLAHSLITLTEADEHANRAGFERVKNVDLTPFLDLGRPRDVVVRAAVTIGRHLPIPGYSWRSLVGGNALQTALMAGLVEFRFVVWRKSESA